MRNVPVTLTVEQWQTVANLLAQHPWHQVNAILVEIQRQVQAAQEASSFHSALRPAEVVGD